MAFSFRHKAEEASAALPPLLPRAEKIALSVLQGHHPRRKSGPGEKFWQFREYTHDDRLQDIDWRQSAKSQRIYVRQKERTALQTNLFWCAAAPSMHFKSENYLPEKYESAALLTMTLSLMLSRSGENAGMLHGPRPSHTEKTLREIEALLVQNAQKEELPALQGRALPRHCGLFLAGDFLSTIEDIKTAFTPFSAMTRNVTVMQILDPAEIELPYHGRVRFQHPGGSDDVPIDHAASIRAEYQKRIAAHQKALKELCATLGWNYILHITSQKPEATLLEIWRMTGGA